MAKSMSKKTAELVIKEVQRVWGKHIKHYLGPVLYGALLDQCLVMHILSMFRTDPSVQHYTLLSIMNSARVLLQEEAIS